MAPHSSTLAWKSHGWRSLVGCSPWGHKESDMTEWLHLYFSLSRIGEGNGNPLYCSCLENPRDGGAWWAAVYGVAQSWTRLKQCSSSKLQYYICFRCTVLWFNIFIDYTLFGFIIKYLLYSLCCIIHPIVVYFIHSSLCLLIPYLYFDLSSSLCPLVTTSLFFISVSLFPFCYIHSFALIFRFHIYLSLTNVGKHNAL